MISSVRGEVLVRRPDHVVVEAAGVGYRMAVSAETLKSVPAVGGEARLHTHLVTREDSMSLFGFAAEEERELFCHLLSVSGVGPKMALAILSRGAPRELLHAIASGDGKRFQAAPGVGKRTAERIIVELRESVAAELGGMPEAAQAGPEDPRREAREGLIGLGYRLEEAERLLDGANGGTPEELIAAALRAAQAPARAGS